jgi:hypothetical protein
MQLLQNLQSLEKANSDQQLEESGFTALETYSGMLGQPELTFAIKGLQEVLDFTGAFSGGSSTATADALKTISVEIADIWTQLQAQQAAQNKTAASVVRDHNRTMRDNIDSRRIELSDQLRILYPPSDGIIKTRMRSPAGALIAGGGGASPPVTVSADVARGVAYHVAEIMNRFVDEEDSHFIGDDLQDDGHGNKSPKEGLKPFPALNVYLAALKLYVTSLEIISGGTQAGRQAILNDRGEPNRRPYVTELKRQIAFLRSAANGGVDKSNPQPLQDRIMAQESCSWQIGGSGGGNYPDRNGTCNAVVQCPDNISRRIVVARTTYKQPDTNSLCQFDQVAQPLTNGSSASQFMNPVDKAVRLQYGLASMDKMANVLSLVATTGTAVQAQGLAGGNFGHTASKEFFAYGIGAMGAVKSFAGSNNQGLNKPTTAGFMPDIVALIPGGNTVFYTVSKDGKLNWYQFTGNNSNKPFQGPVVVGTGFGAYKQVIGGSEGVIYAIQNDGTLLWFHHEGYATGAGNVGAPKTVGSGWAQFKQVFAAGHGILYGMKNDGSVNWYRHQDYLTGDSVTTGNSTPAAPQAGPPQDRGANARLYGTKGSAVLHANAMNPGAHVPTAHWDGPVQVATWPTYDRIMGAGDGVVLALQHDGKLQWYRHDDYLTGTSNGQSSGGSGASGTSPWGGNAGSTLGNKTAGVWGSANSSGTGGNSGMSSTPSWGSQQANRSNFGGGTATFGNKARFGAGASNSGGETITQGGTQPQAQTTFNDSTHSQLVGKAHWEGPTLIDAHSGWESLNDLAASLPAASANAIK